jgi:hypothetical protein
MREGVAGLLRDKTRKSESPALPLAVIEWVVELTLGAAGRSHTPDQATPKERCVPLAR